MSLCKWLVEWVVVGLISLVTSCVVSYYLRVRMKFLSLFLCYLKIWSCNFLFFMVWFWIYFKVECLIKLRELWREVLVIILVVRRVRCASANFFVLMIRLENWWVRWRYLMMMKKLWSGDVLWSWMNGYMKKSVC